MWLATSSGSSAAANVGVEPDLRALGAHPPHQRRPKSRRRGAAARRQITVAMPRSGIAGQLPARECCGIRTAGPVGSRTVPSVYGVMSRSEKSREPVRRWR